MTDLDHLPVLTVEDNQPIAVRRKRRSSAAPSSYGSSPLSATFPAINSRIQHGISTPPTTPRRVKKRVRFSDPGPAITSPLESASSGLTPFIRRTSLSTPSSRRRQTTPGRRHSLPVKLSNRAQYDAPISGELQFAPLRQVLEGRVKRRLRRNGLSEEINIIEWDKRHEAKGRKLELERLQEELATRDLEVQSLRDEQDIASQIEGESGVSLNTGSSQSTKIQELEQVIQDLRVELQQKEMDDDATIEDTHNWTLAAKDPFELDDDDDDDNMMTNYDFDDNDEMDTTPTRLNTSFPSPPSTKHNTPSTPSKAFFPFRAGIQRSVPTPNPETQALKNQLEVLRSDITKLTSTIAFNGDHHARLEQKLADFVPLDESHDHSSLDSALDTVLTQLALSESKALEQQNAFSALSTEIGNLGFPSSGPEQALETIAQQFRQARLDLEYLTPGEVVEGFENEKLLEMLVSRIKVLIEKSKRNDDSIDEYHEQELLLRQQLNTRVSINEDLRTEIDMINNVAVELREEIEEKDVSNERLQSALEGYRQEVAGLEKLIENMEQESRQQEGRLRSEIDEADERLQNEILKHDTTKAVEEGKDMIITELERRLNASLQAFQQVQDQLNALATSDASKDILIGQTQAAAFDAKIRGDENVGLREDIIADLRQEVERLNTALESAHSTIISLRTDNQQMGAQLVAEKERGMFFAKSLNEQLAKSMEMNMAYINGTPEPLANTIPSQEGNEAVVKPGQFFDPSLARRKSGKKRRRYDSGLGFLEEGDEGELDMTI